MGIAFTDPLVLGLLPFLLALTLILHVGSRRRIGTFRRRASLVFGLKHNVGVRVDQTW